MAINFIMGVTNRLITNLPVVASSESGQAGKAAEFLYGTITADADADDMAPIDVAQDVVYAHSISNVLTYDQSVEATWGAIAIGDLVYYDPTALPTDPAHTPLLVRLTTSPLDNAGGTNQIFGRVIGNADATATANVALRVWILQDRSTTL